MSKIIKEPEGQLIVPASDAPPELLKPGDPMFYWYSQPLKMYKFLTHHYPEFRLNMFVHWVSISLPTMWVEPRNRDSKPKFKAQLSERSFMDHRAMLLDANLAKLSRVGNVDMDGTPWIKKKKNGEEYLAGRIYKCSLSLCKNMYKAHLFLPGNPYGEVTLKIQEPDRAVLLEIRKHLWVNHLVSKAEFTFDFETQHGYWLFSSLALSAYMKWPSKFLELLYKTTKYIGNPRAEHLNKAIRIYIKGSKNDQDLQKMGDKGVHFEVVCGRRFFEKRDIETVEELIFIDPVEDVLDRVHFGCLDLAPLSQGIKEDKRFWEKRPPKGRLSCRWSNLSKLGKKKATARRRDMVNHAFRFSPLWVRDNYADLLGKQEIKKTPMDQLIRALAKEKKTFFPK